MAALTLTLDDNTGLTDSGTSKTVAAIFTDSIGLTDAGTQSGQEVIITDSVGLTDAGAQSVIAETLTDSVGLVDSLNLAGTSGGTIAITITDSVGLTDPFFLEGGSAPEPASPTVLPSMPTTVVEFAFDAAPETGSSFHLDDPVFGVLGSATLAPEQSWVDVTRFVRSVSIARNAERVDSPVIGYSAGTAVITLNNADRRFDPTNLTGPYVSAGISQVQPMRGVRVSATWRESTFELFRGFVDRWDVSWSPTWSEVQVPATDAFKVLQAYDRAELGAAVGSGESASARVTRILDDAGWPVADRDIGPGGTILQGTTMGGPALAELQLTADTDAADLFVDPSGRVVFRARTSRLTEPRSNQSQATFGDDLAAGELPYADVTLEYDDSTLFNIAMVARAGDGTPVQTARNEGSVEAFLPHAFTRADLMMLTDTDALAYAQFVVGVAGIPELRFTQLELRPRRLPDALFPQALGRRLVDRVTVVRRPVGGGDPISRDVYVRGVTHEITGDNWVTTWQLSTTVGGDLFVLDSPIQGVLGTHRLAF